VDPKEDEDMTVAEIAPIGASLTLPPLDKGAALADRARARAAALVRHLAASAATEGRTGAHAEEGPLWDRPDQYQMAVFRDAWRNSLDRARHLDYARFDLADLDAGQYPRVLTEWLRDVAGGRPAKQNMILFGGVGSGKTTAAIALGNAAVAAPVMTRYVRHGDYLRWLRPDGAPPGLTALKVREFHDRCPLLILDELCGDMDSQAKEFVRQETGSLLDARIASGLSTLVATNMPSHDVKAILGDRFVSRLGAKAVALEFSSADRRKPVSWGTSQPR